MVVVVVVVAAAAVVVVVRSINGCKCSRLEWDGWSGVEVDNMRDNTYARNKAAPQISVA